MFPRVARLYGQTWCAACMSSSPCGGSSVGSAPRSVTARPKPSSSAPRVTFAVISDGSMSRPWSFATRLSAEWKHAA